MLGKDMLIKQWDFNRWANGRILECAEKISQDQFEAPSNFGRSLQEILFHMLRTDWVWRNLSEHGRILVEDLPRSDQFHDLKIIRTRLQEEEKQMQALISHWNEADLAEAVTVQDRDGTVSKTVRWHMLVHLLFHNMQHRTEAAAILATFSQSPGDLDFINYI